MKPIHVVAAFAAVAVSITAYTWIDTSNRQKEIARLQEEAKRYEAEAKRKGDELARQAKEREQAERLAREKAANEKYAQQQKQAAANQLRTASMRDAVAIESILKRFADEHAIAQRTSRIALGQRVAAMQSLRREMEALKVSDCMGIAHISARDSMNKVISGYLSFMSQSSAEAEAASHFSDGARSIDQYRLMRDSCLRS